MTRLLSTLLLPALFTCTCDPPERTADWYENPAEYRDESGRLAKLASSFPTQKPALFRA